MKRATEDVPNHRGLHEDPQVSVAGRQSCGFPYIRSSFRIHFILYASGPASLKFIMHPIVVGLLILSPCFAHPAQNAAPLQLWNEAGPSMGFPAEYLPIEFSNTTTSNTLGFTLPLNPSTHLELEQEITLIAGIPPRGVELIATIATGIYGNWKDIANARIGRKIDARRLPFRDFELITEPKLQPGAALTPLKIGIVSCWMMSKCLDAPDWPGAIQAVVWDAVPDGDRRALEVGTLEITNLPLSATASSTLDGHPTSTSNDTTLALGSSRSPSSGGSSASGTSPGIPGPVEKRWLACWSTLFLYALKYRPADVVIDNMPPVHPAPGKAATFHFPCAHSPAPHPGDTLDITIYAGSLSPEPSLTFGKLVPAMLAWITRVAATEEAYRLPELIRDDYYPSARYASMAIVLAPLSNDVVATA